MGPKKEPTPEQIMAIKFRAKCRFRALARRVLANAHWLIEYVDNYDGLENVKRRVAQAVRAKSKATKQLLTIQDKTLLNVPGEDRTNEQKQYLYKILGGLKCFKRYPNHVKKKLAALAYFKYYGPGRTIVRQDQEAHAMYFVVTGDLVVSQLVWDELLQKHESTEIAVMHPGDMFGEVSLLHNIPRTATVTAGGHVELLALMKQDFKSVLHASVQKQWEEVRRAMALFTYFEGLDAVACREGCILAKMKSYATNETVLGDGVGVPNFVYFVLTGRCQMIETLKIRTTTISGRHHFTLQDVVVQEQESDEDIESKYFKAYNNKKGLDVVSEQASLVNSSCKIDFKDKKVSINLNKCEGRDETSSLRPSCTRSAHSAAESAVRIVLQPTEDTNKRASFAAFESQTDKTKKEVETGLNTYFMQVCQFNPGSTFGFGENMRDRRIVALTPVQCMLMPKVWLLQRNTANIWTRVQYYLEKKIPDKKKVFKEFVSGRRWQRYKSGLVHEVVDRKDNVNFTSVHDVPYSVRLEEMVDIRLGTF